MAYDPLRDSWGETWGETWDGSWCWDLPEFGKWKPIQWALCLWGPVDLCEHSAIANIAIANDAIANTVCKKNGLGWNRLFIPCAWEKVNV